MMLINMILVYATGLNLKTCAWSVHLSWSRSPSYKPNSDYIDRCASFFSPEGANKISSILKTQMPSIVRSRTWLRNLQNWIVEKPHATELPWKSLRCPTSLVKCINPEGLWVGLSEKDEVNGCWKTCCWTSKNRLMWVLTKARQHFAEWYC